MRSIVLIWIGMAAAISIGLGSVNVPRLVQLYRHQAIVQGIVESSDCANHSTVFYEFAVSGTRYTGHGLTAGDCRAFNRGASVTVYYVMDRPEVSSLREPRAALINEVGTALLGGLFLPPWLIFGGRIKSSFRDRNK